MWYEQITFYWVPVAVSPRVLWGTFVFFRFSICYSHSMSFFLCLKYFPPYQHFFKALWVSLYTKSVQCRDICLFLIKSKGERYSQYRKFDICSNLSSLCLQVYYFKVLIIWVIPKCLQRTLSTFSPSSYCFDNKIVLLY